MGHKSHFDRQNHAWELGDGKGEALTEGIAGGKSENSKE